MPKEERPLLETYQKIELGKINRVSVARLMCFLLCIGILTAAFAVSGVWKDGRQWFGSDGVQSEGEEASRDEQTPLPPSFSSSADTNDKSEEKADIPAGAIPVVSMDLSCDWTLRAMLENQTAYRVNVENFLSMPIVGTVTDAEPLVLILHTHATEAYLDPDTAYITGEVGDAIYSDQENRSVIEVGKVLCSTLNEKGIPAVHCAQKHGKDGSLQNAYASSEACIKAYLKRYPSIQYIIDIHRDGILNSSGELVKTEILAEGKSYGQVMAVVGSDGNGTNHPHWRQNLALALQLCNRLNETVESLCRTVSLRNASYNQELAPYSLLLEIGSAGNTQEEAIRTVELVGETLSRMILESITS